MRVRTGSCRSARGEMENAAKGVVLPEQCCTAKDVDTQFNLHPNGTLRLHAQNWAQLSIMGTTSVVRTIYNSFCHATDAPMFECRCWMGMSARIRQSRWDHYQAVNSDWPAPLSPTPRCRTLPRNPAWRYRASIGKKCVDVASRCFCEDVLHEVLAATFLHALVTD